ncbi:reverse transcriptase domain-containing protein [Tanacetum coccineum]
MPQKRASTSEAPAMTQAGIRKLVADSVTAALEAQAATMASASNPNRNPNPTETPAVKMGNYKEFINSFIEGLPRSIEGNVTASKPQTLEEAINIAQRLMDQVTKHTPIQVSSDNKRKFNDRINFNNNSRNNNNYRNTNNRYNNHQLQQNRRQEAVRAYAATPPGNNRYAGDLPLCKRCNLHHTGPCTGKCNICNKVGYLSKNCRSKKPATESNQLPVTVICHACGEKGHYTNQCRKTNINAQGRAYMLRDKNAHQDLNVVTAQRTPIDWLPSEMQEISNHYRKEQLSQGLHVDPAKIEAVKKWTSPTTPTEVCQFLGLAGYYRIFIEAPILTLPEGNDDFVVYCDASLQGLGAVLMQGEKVIAYASRQLKPHEETITTPES